MDICPAAVQTVAAGWSSGLVVGGCRGGGISKCEMQIRREEFIGGAAELSEELAAIAIALRNRHRVIN